MLLPLLAVVIIITRAQVQPVYGEAEEPWWVGADYYEALQSNDTFEATYGSTNLTSTAPPECVQQD